MHEQLSPKIWVVINGPTTDKFFSDSLPIFNILFWNGPSLIFWVDIHAGCRTMMLNIIILLSKMLKKCFWVIIKSPEEGTFFLQNSSGILYLGSGETVLSQVADIFAALSARLVLP